MYWPLFEYSIYLVLMLMALILMCTKLCNKRNKINIQLYEKKLDILHKKFLQYHQREKQDHHQSLDEENRQQVPKVSKKELNCITHGIGEFKIVDQQLQKTNILKIMRLVKLNGETFQHSKMTDIKLYQKVRWFQLIEYQNIIINKLFSYVKIFQRSKIKLVWFLAQLQMQRKSVLYLILKEEKLGYLHKIASIFIFFIEVAAILVMCQSIRRSFTLSWYSSDDEQDDSMNSSKIVLICFLLQFFIVTPIFLLFQHKIEVVYSEYQCIKKKLIQLQKPNNVCCTILTENSINVMFTFALLALGIYQSICMSYEIHLDITSLVFIIWFVLCLAELFLFRNFYIIVYNLLQQYIYTISQLQQNVRQILFIQFIIQKTQNKGRDRLTDDIRKSIMQKITTQQKIKMQKEMTKIKTQKAKSEKQVIEQNQQEKDKENQLENQAEEKKEIESSQQQQQEQDQDQEQEHEHEGGTQGIQDLLNFSSFLDEIENIGFDTEKQDSLSNNLKESSENNNNNNNILPQSILNKNTNSINSYKLEQNNDDFVEEIQQETTKENFQAIDKINKEIVETVYEQNVTEKKLNTSLAINDESMIQEEQQIVLDTVAQLKQPKNKRNYSYSRILNSTFDIQTFKPNPHFNRNSRNNTTDIKSFMTIEACFQKNNFSTFNQFQEILSESNQKKTNLNESSSTINREISVGKINNLQTCNIMKLQEQKKYENDISFLKNLAEIKQIKQNNLFCLNKSNNEISIFGQKETSFLVNEEFIQNNLQKNNNSESYILNKSELLEILKPYGLTSQQNA